MPEFKEFTKSNFFRLNSPEDASLLKHNLEVLGINNVFKKDASNHDFACVSGDELQSGFP